ncbi:TonB-dependent receptor [Maribacter halichondriae]|uniref:TonB-dependent receptor n=1 Tax=Maribacter halichondriae TaxID=2980554 RepID=UPI002359944F|nr:carboxypeptidase-like regulatory domain-containing protein [Maribacter sp. Hal144]
MTTRSKMNFPFKTPYYTVRLVFFALKNITLNLTWKEQNTFKPLKHQAKSGTKSVNRILSYIILLFLLCNFVTVSAQDAPSAKPLIEVLNELHIRFGYQFNYASETVDGIQVVPPSKELSFDESLHFIHERTRLIFTVLDDKIVSVKKPEPQLCGYLKDKNIQEPIVNATVQSGKNSTITDENGYFELKLKTQNVIISIRHIGYKTLDRSYQFFKEYTCGTIYLVPDELQLTEVVLSDFLIRGIDKLNDGSFKIDFDRFSILPGLIETDVLQSVQAFPGIQSINETVSDINIRGGTNDQNLILWDGIKMYQSGHFFGLISMYNPQITQKVSLRKNGTPVGYTDGVSGTIAMETDKKINSKLQANVAFNFLDGNAFVDVPLGKKSSVQVAARKAISNFVESPTYTAYFDRIKQDTEVASNANTDLEFDFYDHSLRWLYQPSEKDEIQLNFINANNELIFNENATVGGVEESRRSSVAQNSIAGGLQYHRSWTDRLRTSFHIYETDYTLNASNANILDNQRFTQKNSVSETGVKLESQYQLTDEWQIMVGYQYIDSKVTNLDSIDNPRFKRLEGEVLRTHAGFTQLGYVSKDKMTTLNAGVRYNYLDKLKKHLLEPRFSFNQRFLNSFNLEILGEFKHQNTSQIINFQNDFLGIEKRRWRLSNDVETQVDDVESIPVNIGKQISAGLSFSDKGWLVNLVGYYKDVNGITASSQGFQNQYEFRTGIGGYDAIGVDLLIRKQFKNLNTWLSYSYLSSDYTFTFESEPQAGFANNPEQANFANNLEVVHSATFGATYTTPHFLFSAGMNWHSGKPITRPVEGNEILEDNSVNYGPANNDRLDDYMRVDLSAIYQFKMKGTSKVNIGVSVWNLLDKENTINNFYKVNALGTAEEVEQNSLGITPNAVLRVYL